MDGRFTLPHPTKHEPGRNSGQTSECSRRERAVRPLPEALDCDPESLRDGHEQATVHAEQNAVADAARRGSSVEGCVAYVTHFPCINCAKILAAAGIAEIKYRADYLNDPLVAPLLTDAGVKVLKL